MTKTVGFSVMNRDVQEIVIYEIREARKELKALRGEVNALKLSVFSNKVKLGTIMATVSIAIS